MTTRTFYLSNSMSKTPSARGLFDFAKVKFGKRIFLTESDIIANPKKRL